MSDYTSFSLTLAAPTAIQAFAATDGQNSALHWRWEIRSTRCSSLEIRVRLPELWESLEALVRRSVTRICRRGSLYVSLQVDPRGHTKRVNVQALREIAQQLQEERQRQNTQGLPDEIFWQILHLPGMILETPSPMQEEQKRTDLSKTLQADFTRTLTTWNSQRKREGKWIAQTLAKEIDSLQKLVLCAQEQGKEQGSLLQTRFLRKMRELLPRSITTQNDHVDQEIALLVQQSAVEEEVLRLQVHAKTFKEALQTNTSGYKLAFLCQDMHRQAAKLSEKAATAQLVALGLEIRNVCEGLRENVQNLE